SELAMRAEAARPAGAEVLVSQGTPPSPPVLALVRGDLVISDARQGSGLLLVEGALDIRGSLDFTGLVVAAGGLRIAEGAALGVVGALWLGEPGVSGGIGGGGGLRWHPWPWPAVWRFARVARRSWRPTGFLRYRDALSCGGSVMSARASRAAARRVLVVENDPESRRMTKVLALEGYETLEAPEGRSAIAL